MELKDWLGEDNTLGMDIWKKKYCFENESFDNWLDRISNNDSALKQLILDKKFLFGGRILANRGLQKYGKNISYSNCYVIPAPQDNMADIMRCASDMAETYKMGGGCGIHLNNLRPNGAIVNNNAKSSTGPICFMDLYSTVTGVVAQNGRRGALMIAMEVKHPDIEEFIGIKQNLDKVDKANISVMINDEFMKAVINDTDYELYFKTEKGQEFKKTVKAKEIMHKIAFNAWDMGEPGMLFWDRVNNWNLMKGIKEFVLECTNPCAELPLPASSGKFSGACLLGSINLAEYVKNPFKPEACFDFESFAKDVEICIISLNTCLDESTELHALDIQKNAAKFFRSIGLGVMGVANMSIKLWQEYGDDEFIKLIDKIGFILADSSIKQSALLARDFGKAPCLKDYKNSVLTTNPFIKKNTTKETLKLVSKYGLRNAQLLTTAPTGTISTMIKTSGGIEPLYDCSYTRTTKSLHGKDVNYEVFENVVEQYKEINGEVPVWIRNSTAKKLDWKKRIAVQSTWQNHIDNAISSTLNLPESTTVEDIANIYIKAWESGLKGVTVFRDNCRRIGILNSNKKEVITPVKTETKTGLQWGDIVKSSDELIGFKKKLNTGCGSLHVQAFFDHQGNFKEIYLSKGSTGGCNSFMVGLSRMISLAARAGVKLETIVDQLHSTINCPSYIKRAYTSAGTSCPNALGHALIELKEQQVDKFFNNLTLNKDIKFEKEDEKTLDKPFKSQTTKCPECGVELFIQEGCMSCKSCGYSKCG